MTLGQYPTKYVEANAEQTKQVSIIVEIEGSKDLYGLTGVYTRIRYGDPDLYYGMPGLIYGGLRLVSNVKEYLTLEGSLTISQRLEPEQGKASISTFTLVFIDKDGSLTQLISRGPIVDEILGNKEVKIWLGYRNISFPEDYFCVFRGTVATTSVNGPKVTLGLADANQKTRSQVFNTSKTKLVGGITDTDTAVPVISCSDFYDRVLGPNGTYCPDVRLWLKIEDEWMEYETRTNTNITVVRSALTAPVGWQPTTPASHADGTDVSCYIEFLPQNAITLALRLFMSGWAAPWKTGIATKALGRSLDPANTATNLIYSVEDMDDKYGLVVGDYVTITGASNPSNNGTFIVADLDQDLGELPGRLIYLDTNLIGEYPTLATFSIRSQYDVFPVAASLKMRPTEVDIPTHVGIRDMFLSDLMYNFSLTQGDKIAGKEFVESELFLATGCYSLTRYGRLSMGFTRPPVIINDKLVALSKDNVVNPQNISWQRALNTRRFYNEIDYSWDYDEKKTAFTQVLRAIDTTSLNLIGQSSSMAIDVRGARTSLLAPVLADRVTQAMLGRYKNAAFEVQLDVSFAAGSLIESGDIVLLTDNGDLKLPDILNGTRDSGQQLFEVLDRQLDIKTGIARVKLLSGIFDTLSDRYGLISPSSWLAPDSEAALLKIEGVNEFRKWKDHLLSPIVVHSEDFSYSENTILLAFSSINSNWLMIDPPLSAPPPAGYVIDIADYPTSPDQTVDKLYKLLYCHYSPQVSVVSGTSDFIFTVGAGDIGKFIKGALVLVHTENWATVSPETNITDITGDQITVANSLGFTPNSTMLIDFIGFADKGGAYRLF